MSLKLQSSPDQIDTVFRAATPLRPEHVESYLPTVADTLRATPEIGDGHRLPGGPGGAKTIFRAAVARWLHRRGQVWAASRWATGPVRNCSPCATGWRCIALGWLGSRLTSRVCASTDTSGRGICAISGLRPRGDSGTTFAASIPFYPECATAFVDDENVIDAPIRIFHGVADDYVSLPRCRSYVERLGTAGKDVELTEYAGAHGVQFKPPLKLPDAQATRNCRLEVADGIVVNSQTKQRSPITIPAWSAGLQLRTMSKRTSPRCKPSKKYCEIT
jgi:hypothetical protein